MDDSREIGGGGGVPQPSDLLQTGPCAQGRVSSSSAHTCPTARALASWEMYSRVCKLALPGPAGSL